MKKKSIRRKSLGKGRRRLTLRYSRIHMGGTLEELLSRVNAGDQNATYEWVLNPDGYDSPRAYNADNTLRPTYKWVKTFGS